MRFKAHCPLAFCFGMVETGSSKALCSRLLCGWLDSEWGILVRIADICYDYMSRMCGSVCRLYVDIHVYIHMLVICA